MSLTDLEYNYPDEVEDYLRQKEQEEEKEARRFQYGY